MKILITGGAGFLGSHLTEHLLKQGDSVFALDDLSTGSIDNIEHLKTHPRYGYHIESMMNRSLVAELLDHCDAVFHLAAAVGVRLIGEIAAGLLLGPSLFARLAPAVTQFIFSTGSPKADKYGTIAGFIYSLGLPAAHVCVRRGNAKPLLSTESQTNRVARGSVRVCLS